MRSPDFHFMTFGSDPQIYVFLPDVVAVERAARLSGECTRVWLKGRIHSVATTASDEEHEAFIRRWKDSKVAWELIPPSNNPDGSVEPLEPESNTPLSNDPRGW